MTFFHSFANLASLVTALLIPTAPPTNEICFPSADGLNNGVGCFDNALPCHTLDMAAPEDIDVRFTLFTRRNRKKGQEITWRDVRTIEASNFQGKNPTKFVVHGWIENTEKIAFKEMKDAILEAEPRANVIMVDWRGGSLDIYDTSVQNIRVVGREIVILARKLNRLFHAPYSKMHGIGHSLGAHAVGYAGSELPGFGRITGLDPAGPYFQGPLHNDCRLDKTDALFVDVIHTDGTNSSSIIPGMYGLGLQEQVGHQDFYPNGGEHMTGCMPIGYCSHYRAIVYFIKSISTCGYQPSHHCPTCDLIRQAKTNCTSCNSSNMDCAQMGFHAKPGKEEGAYYLTTAGSPPYC